jgi:DNA-binding XRE family transcriptional regulator
MTAVWKVDFERFLLKKSAKLGRLITIEELANAIGVSRQTIYSWRSGVKNVPAENSAKLAEFLECHVWDLWKLETSDDEETPEGQQVGAVTVMA